MQNQVMSDSGRPENGDVDLRTHWEEVYRTKPATEVSWFEAEPITSLSLIRSVAPEGGRVLDVGGGASSLVDHLLAAGNWDVTVLDVSPSALELARARLKEQASRVRWIAADITKTRELATYDVWHDRAVFHFLTSREERAAYLDRLARALRSEGYAILGTFGLNGPDRCSGLPVCRYSAQTLAATLGSGYSLVRALEHAHVTPKGMTQTFTFGVFRKTV